MRTKLLHEDAGLRTYALVLDRGDEVAACLKDFAAAERITGARVSAIGAFERATMAFYDCDTKDYVDIPVDEQVEVASLNGDIGVEEDGTPALHLHAVLGRRDGSAIAAHLKTGTVRPTLEVILTETPAHLRRVKDAQTGLTLIRLDR